MKPSSLDLFIDRLCGIFPRDNIARNTTKSAWAKDDFLLDVPEELSKKALLFIENDKGFPTLARVKEVFRMLMKATVVAGVECNICDGNGWDTGIRYDFNKLVEVNGEMIGTMTSGPFTSEVLGREYTHVVQCKCVSGYKPKEREPEVSTSSLW